MDHAATPSSQDLRWERRELWLGVPAFVLFAAGLVLGIGVDLRPMNASQVVAYFDDRQARMSVAFMAMGLAVFCLLWFLGAARARLCRAGHSAERLATTALASGAAFCALLLAGQVAASAPSGIFQFGFSGAELDAVAASLFIFLSYDLLAVAGIVASVAVSTLAIAGETSGAMPRWLVVAGYIAALAGLVSIALPYATLPLVMLWFAVASWVLARARIPEADAASQPAWSNGTRATPVR
jgi:hypothetical protein